MHNLGNNGRLGNQIFQFSFLYGLHKAKGYDYCIPPNTDLIKCFDINCKILSKISIPTNREKFFNFDTNFPSFYADETNYTGYYQSEKYFKHCKSELLQTLKFREEWKIPLSQDTQNIVGIHIRRGDYVGNHFHPVVSLDYINKAKTFFLNKKFIVFSDDIEWCKENNIGDFYAENQNHYIDLYQMSICSGLIMANSTFSWWGAYLGEQKKVVAPLRWFIGKNDLDVTPSDIYCQGWILI